MARVLRIGLSCSIVLAAYWSYALVAVPLIEPPAAPPAGDAVSEAQIQEARNAALNDPRRAILAPLFAPGDWELGERAKILESDQFRLLVEDWNTSEADQVELRPCTMIFTPEDDALSEAERIRQSVVLQAPQGARLRFDRPLDLRRGNIGRLKGGMLEGSITIRSAGKLPGPEDDLWVITRDLELTEEGISTPHDVEFRYGAHFGRGANLLVKFLPGDRGTADRRGLNIGGVESFELRHVERLYLGPGGVASRWARGQGTAEASGTPQAGAAKPPDSPRAANAADSPVEITCRGPFRFDLGQQLATFENHVDVRRINARGPSDQIACELLGIHFARRRPSASQGEPPKDRRTTPDLQPRRIEARGHPVVVHAPSQGAEARGEYLDYDLATRRITLRPSPADAQAAPHAEVFVRQGPNEIHAPWVEYDLAEGNRLGQAVAAGPGWVRVELKDRPGQPLVAKWNQELRLRPADNEHVISLTGGAEMSYGGFGALSAAEIYFWLFEVPASQNGAAQIRPDRMLARQQVRIDSLQLSGAVDQLEVWFEQQAAAPEREQAAGTPLPRPARRDPRLETARAAVDLGSRIPSALHEVWRPLNEAGQRLGLAETSPAPAVAPPPVVRTDRAADAPGRHFDITGRLLRARVVTADRKSDVAELMVEGKVHFVESRTAKPDERPLVVKGDRVHVLDAAQPHAAATVTGSPAHFQARGLGLTGSNINLNRGTNRLWIEGPGRLDLVLDRDFRGQPVPEGLPVAIAWRDGMWLDGRTTRFEESVVVTSRDQTLRTDTFEVDFKEAVRFSEPEKQPRPEIEQLRCRGRVVLESRTADDRGLASSERIEVADLAIHLLTGTISAGGPGRVVTTRRGSADAVFDRAAGFPASATAADSQAKPPQSPGLSCLEVRFQRTIAGNFQQRRLTFHDQVRAVFGPVPQWDAALPADRPEALGPRGGVLRCDQLSVVQMVTPGRAEPSVELEAVGNAVVEGEQYTARAHRITYDQKKDLLVLEGDGRNDAQLFRQTYVGGPVTPASARRIQYWPSARRGLINDFHALEHQVPGGGAKP
ncbi:MAG: hypothetical protein NUV77_15745 [Thermoguttaceae bacterium]|jgi:hypothetical protein|nr:hypothetical protein [Thermoguttaceae bacterium]